MRYLCDFSLCCATDQITLHNILPNFKFLVLQALGSARLSPALMQCVLEEMGGVDIVLDDGSHQALDIKALLQILFPMLAYRGLYLMEDLHTSCWRGWRSGYYSKNYFFNIAKEIVNDMHHWYHSRPVNCMLMASSCKGIHVHDSIIVLKRGERGAAHALNSREIVGHGKLGTLVKLN